MIESGLLVNFNVAISAQSLIYTRNSHLYRHFRACAALLRFIPPVVKVWTSSWSLATSRRV